MYELRDPGLLKLAFGSDAAALARAQLPGTRSGSSASRRSCGCRASGATTEQRLVVEWASGHEREYVRFWKRVAGASAHERATPTGEPRDGAAVRPLVRLECRSVDRRHTAHARSERISLRRSGKLRQARRGGRRGGLELARLPIASAARCRSITRPCTARSSAASTARAPRRGGAAEARDSRSFVLVAL